MEGVLWKSKRNSKKNWQRRHFAARPEGLEYYKTKDSSSRLNIIPWDDILSLTLTEEDLGQPKKLRGLGMDLQTIDSVFYLAAETEEERLRWVGHIQEVLRRWAMRSAGTTSSSSSSSTAEGTSRSTGESAARKSTDSIASSSSSARASMEQSAPKPADSKGSKSGGSGASTKKKDSIASDGNGGEVDNGSVQIRVDEPEGGGTTSKSRENDGAISPTRRSTMVSTSEEQFATDSDADRRPRSSTVAPRAVAGYTASPMKADSTKPVPVFQKRDSGKLLRTRSYTRRVSMTEKNADSVGESSSAGAATTSGPSTSTSGGTGDDVLGMNSDASVTEVINKYGDTQVVFSTEAERINFRGVKAKICIALTDVAMYTFKGTSGKYDFRRRVGFEDIASVILDPHHLGFIIEKEDDLLVKTPQRTGVLKSLRHSFQTRHRKLPIRSIREEGTIRKEVNLRKKEKPVPKDVEDVQLDGTDHDDLNIIADQPFSRILASYGANRIYFSGYVDKINKIDRMQKRMLVVTDCHIFNVVPSSKEIRRAIKLEMISHMGADSNDSKLIAFFVPTQNDLLLSTEQRFHIAQCVQNAYKARMLALEKSLGSDPRTESKDRTSDEKMATADGTPSGSHVEESLELKSVELLRKAVHLGRKDTTEEERDKELLRTISDVKGELVRASATDDEDSLRLAITRASVFDELQKDAVLISAKRKLEVLERRKDVLYELRKYAYGEITDHKENVQKLIDEARELGVSEDDVREISSELKHILREVDYLKNVNVLLEGNDSMGLEDMIEQVSGDLEHYQKVVDEASRALDIVLQRNVTIHLMIDAIESHSIDKLQLALKNVELLRINPRLEDVRRAQEMLAIYEEEDRARRQLLFALSSPDSADEDVRKALHDVKRYPFLQKIASQVDALLEVFRNAEKMSRMVAFVSEERESKKKGSSDDRRGDADDDEDDEDDDDDGAAEDLTLLDLRDYVRELEDIIEKVTKSLVVDKIEVLFKQDLVNDIRKKKDLLIVFVRDRIVEELAEGVSKRDIHRLEELKAHYSLVPDDMWREAELQKAAADVLIRQYHACEEMLKELTKGIDEQNIAMLSDLVQRKGTWNEAVNAKLDIAKWLVLQSESDMRVSKRLQDAISVRNARLIEEIVAGIEKMRGDRGDRKTFLELVKMGNEASELLETWKGRGSEPESETLHKETVIGKGDGTGASDIKQGEKSVTIASAALVGGGAAAALVAGSLVASRNDESEERVDEISESVQEQGERENSESDGKLSSHGGMKEWKEDGDGTGDDTSHEHHEKSGEKDDGIVKESVSTASSCEEVVKHGDELDVEGQYESAMKGETIDLLRKPLVGNPLYVQSLSHLLGILELVMKDPQYLEGLRDHALVVSEDIAFVVIGDHFVAYDEEVYRKALQTRLKTLSETYHAAMMMKEKAAAEEHLLALQELTEFYSSKIRRGRVIEFPFGSKISVLYDPVSKHWSLLRCPCPPPLALPSDEELARARALWASGTAPPLQFDRLQTRVESDDHTAKRVFAGQSSSTSHEISRRASDALSGPEMKPIQEAGDASGSADLSGANDERSPQDVRAGEAILREIGRSMEDLGEWRKLHGEGVVMVPNSPFTLRLILLMMEGLHHGFKSTRFLLRRTPFDVIVSAADASSYVHGILHTFTSECRVFVFMEEEDIEFSTGHCAYMLLFLMYTMNMHNVHDVLSLALGSANLKKFYHPHALMLNSVFQNAFLDAILPIQRYGFNLPTENIRAFENFTRVLFSTDRPVLPRQPVDPSEAAAVASLPPPMPAPLPESSSPFQQSGVTVVKDDGSQKVLPASETDTESSTRKGGGRESSPPPQPPQVSDKVRDTPLGQISLARYPPVMQQLISVYDLFVSHFARESSADDPRALEALGNEERHAEVGVLVRRDLCNVLAGILLPGFRSKRRFGRDQTLYDMFVFLGKDIRDENEIVSNGTNVVSVMIGDGFDAGIRFRALVCYALNVGILHKMFELLFRNSATLAKYYDLFDSGTDLLIANPHFRFDCVRVIAALEKFRFHVAINGETRMRPPSM